MIGMLYVPEPLISQGQLRISDPTLELEVFYDGRRRDARFKNKVFEQLSININEYNDQPMYALLRRCGIMIPEKQWDGSKLILKEESSHDEVSERLRDRADRHDDWIDLSLVCFHTLHNVASIKIQWVECLALHLEFDSRTKVLSVFKFPSFAFLMCNSNLLSRYVFERGSFKPGF